MQLFSGEKSPSEDTRDDLMKRRRRRAAETSLTTQVPNVSCCYLHSLCYGWKALKAFMLPHCNIPRKIYLKILQIKKNRNNNE